MNHLSKRSSTILLYCLIIFIPLLIINTWGIQFSDDVYIILRYARNFADGKGFNYGYPDALAATGTIPLLYSLFIALIVRFGAVPTYAAAFFSALGWSATAFAFLAIGKSKNKTAGGALAAILLCFSPAIILTSGSAASWTIAIFWWAIALTINKRYFLAVITFLLFILSILQWPISQQPGQPMVFSAFAWSLILFFAGFSTEYLAEWLNANDVFRTSKNQTAAVTSICILLLIGGYQALRLGQLFQSRDEAEWVLDNDIANWLQLHTPVDAALGASEKIGYLADRPVNPIDETPLLNQETSIAFFQEFPIDYLISNNTTPWQQLANDSWFRLNFQAVQSFTNPYNPQAPYTIWQSSPPQPNAGIRQEINARVPDRLKILGYQLNQAKSVDNNQLELTLHVEKPAATIESFPHFTAMIRLLSPWDFSSIEEWEVTLPQEKEAVNWQQGDQIVEKVLLNLPPDLEPGAYPINLSLIGPESTDLWPISLNNDLQQLDRIPIGYLTIPVEFDPNNIQSREASLGRQIKLLGFNYDKAQPGEPLGLTIFWQAIEPIEENHVVFTHILDSNGQLVANHDSVPENGRFPTPAWIPGVMMADTHTINLPPDLPPGEYQILVGMYSPESGERVLAEAVDGTPFSNNAVPLTNFTIP